MTTNPDDAREIARDLRTTAGKVLWRAPHLTDLLREAATALDALAADVERMMKEKRA